MSLVKVRSIGFSSSSSSITPVTFKSVLSKSSLSKIDFYYSSSKSNILLKSKSTDPQTLGASESAKKSTKGFS